MLISVILGNQTSISKEWSITTDQYDNTFITNSEIGQRIRLGKNVVPTLEVAYSASNVSAYNIAGSAVESTDDVSAYNIAKTTFFSNNNKNMNMTLMNFWNQNREVMEAHEDDSILYITMTNSNYKLINYDNMGNEIVQTYKRKDTYQGCAIKFKKSDIQTDKFKLFQIYVKDFVLNRFVGITIYINKEMKILVEKKAVEDTETTASLKIAYRKLGKRINHFKMCVKPGTLLTSTYIVTPEHADEAEELVRDINNADIIVLGRNSFDENLSYQDKMRLKEILTEHITKQHVRAITTMGLRLPYEFCRDYSILYAFSYNGRTNQLTCNKSN